MKKYFLFLAIVAPVICLSFENYLPCLAEPADTGTASSAAASLDKTSSLVKSIKDNMAQASALKIGVGGYQSQLDRILGDQSKQDPSVTLTQLTQLSDALTQQIKQCKAKVAIKPKYTPKLVEFYKEDCHFCQAFAPFLAHCQQIYGKKLILVQLDVADPDNKRLMNSLGGTVVPTCVIIDGFGRYASPLKGYVSESQLLGYVQGLIGR